jgi:hypothetical protein
MEEFAGRADGPSALPGTTTAVNRAAPTLCFLRLLVAIFQSFTIIDSNSWRDSEFPPLPRSF